MLTHRAQERNSASALTRYGQPRNSARTLISAITSTKRDLDALCRPGEAMATVDFSESFWQRLVVILLSLLPYLLQLLVIISLPG